MKDALIGVAVLAGMALFVYALIRAGRQQRRARGDIFRAFAARRGWEYTTADGDDRGLRQFLEPFQGIGIYRRSSGGECEPPNVVAGEVELGRVWTFWHWRDVNEGSVLQFHACLLAGPVFDGEGVIVRFAADGSPSSVLDIYYGGHRDRVRVGPRELRVFEAEPGSARRLLSGPLGRSVAGEVEQLPWTVDLQIGRGALALYTISRNLDLSGPDELALLTDVTGEVARLLARNTS